MDCKNCVDDLTAYLDGELDGTRSNQIKTHIQACPACLGELQGLERSLRLVESNIEEIEPKPEIWDGLVSRIAAQQAQHRPVGFFQLLVSHRWTAATATLAASIVLAAGGWGLWNHHQAEQAVRRYMDEYVQLRAHQEEIRLAATADAGAAVESAVEAHAEYADNPFVDIEAPEIENPFRSEEQ